MADDSLCFWKRLWRWISSGTLSNDDVLTLLGNKTCKIHLEQGLNFYKSFNKDQFSELKKKHPDDTKILAVVENLQTFLHLDSFQCWDILMHYLSNAAYGDLSNALKNITFIDMRATQLLPNVWNFYYSERLFLLKIIKYLLEFKDDTSHKHHSVFDKIIHDIGVERIKESAVEQFECLLNASLPNKRQNGDFVSTNLQKKWTEHNLIEQLELLQILLILVDKSFLTEKEFSKLFGLFKNHDFGKRQSYSNILDEHHREIIARICYSEVAIFIAVVDHTKINNIESWINATSTIVESELIKLQLHGEHSAILISWMMLSLRSESHKKHFESKYQQFGIKALQLQVFKFFTDMLRCSILSDKSKCSVIVKLRLFSLLNDLCDMFDGDGSISHQPYIIELCGILLSETEIAEKFWSLYELDDNYGVISLWNTALEFFPLHFIPLSTLSAGLAKAGQSSTIKLRQQLESLPVFTEFFNPNHENIKVSLNTEEVTILKDYYPFSNKTYVIHSGSKAAIMERKEGTMIHYRTPISYWNVLINYIDKILDRRIHNPNDLLILIERINLGNYVLKEVLKCASTESDLSKDLITPSEAAFDILDRFMKVENPPLELLVSCLDVSTALVPIFTKEIYTRLINMDLLPKILNPISNYVDYANGVGFNSCTVGHYLVTYEMTNGSYSFLNSYIDMLNEFYNVCVNEKIINNIILPGLILIVHEIFPNFNSWRFKNIEERRNLISNCITFIYNVIQMKTCEDLECMVVKTCVYSFMYTENALELLKLITIGEEKIQKMMEEETNWVTGSSIYYLKNLQKFIGLLMQTLRLKRLVVSKSDELTPLEQLVYAHTKQKDIMKLVPTIVQYINNPFNHRIPTLACRVLIKFALEMDMSLFSCLEMTAHQVRVMFLNRLRDDCEFIDLKVAILDFVTSCVEKQPAMIEAFFSVQHDKKADRKSQDGCEHIQDGILSFMAEYLEDVKSNTFNLHSPLLNCIMSLFHALWKNNMQVLIKDLRENPKFWEYMISPLFSNIQPGLRTYSQIFNVLGIELFTVRDKIEPELKQQLEKFFDLDNDYLGKWINYIYSFNGRHGKDEPIDEVPIWLGLLTSWKDFTMIFAKCLPISLNIAHKSKFVSPCLKALLREVEDMSDSRLVVILSELYVIMLSNWKDDCFDNKKEILAQINDLLNHTSIVYDCLHPRAKRALLSIGTVAIYTLDYDIKANIPVGEQIITSVTAINGLELDMFFANIQKNTEQKVIGNSGNGVHINEDIAPIVLSLTMLEQCFDVYDEMFTGLVHWFQSVRFVNKVFSCLNMCLQDRRYYHTSLGALRCLTAYARGPFSADLLNADIDQFLFLPLLPPIMEATDQKGNILHWRPSDWWNVYGSGLDLISMIIMKHGQMFANDAITFVGIHLEHIVDTILLPKHYINIGVLNVCASALNLIKQLVRYEARWRMVNNDSLSTIMRCISVCLYHCVSLSMRSRVIQQSVEPCNTTNADEQTPTTPSQKAVAIMNRLLELIHTSALCLLSFSPNLLDLLADPCIDIERWQPIIDLNFGAPKIINESFPQLNFGTLLSAITLLTRSLNHTYHTDDLNTSSSRSPKPLTSRRRPCSCSSPGEGSTSKRIMRSESVTSISSTTSTMATGWLTAFDKQLVSNTLQVILTLLGSQALLFIRDQCVSFRDKQLVRREIGSELTLYHEFVKKRILPFNQIRNPLLRNKLGIWPLNTNEDELKQITMVRKDKTLENNMQCEDDDHTPPPPPPKRAMDSMREFLLRKQHLNKARSFHATTPSREKDDGFTSFPNSHSTPIVSEKKKESIRSLKKVSWAETTQESGDEDSDIIATDDMVYSTLTDVEINNDEDYLHFMSNVFLYICQAEL